MSKRPQIGLIQSRFPFPAIGGDRYKAYHLIKTLSRFADLHLVAMHEEEVSDEALAEIEKYCSSVKVFVKSKPQHYLKALRFLFNSSSIQENYYRFSDVSEHVANMDRSIDIWIPTTVRMFQYVSGSQRPVVFDAVDSISLNYQRSLAKARSFFWRWMYRIESKRLYKAESKAVELAACSLFVNRSEAAYWRQIGETLWTPNGVEQALLQRELASKTEADQLLFFGKMDYQPNVDAALFLVKEVLPLLRSKHRLLFLGSASDQFVSKHFSGDERISGTGFVDDPYGYLAKAKLVVLPMQTGGGIQNKVLQAMALGCTVISSSLGADPIIGAQHGVHFLVADSAKDLADLIEQGLSDQLNTDEMAKAARQLIADNYTWDAVGIKLQKLTAGFGA